MFLLLLTLGNYTPKGIEIIIIIIIIITTTTTKQQ